MICNRLFSASLLLSLAACSLGKTLPENFYTLSAEPFVGGAVASDALRGKRIAVALVHIDELVDRPQWVLRTTPNQVSVLEQQRWAEDLKTQIPQLVAENLQKLLPQAQATAMARGAQAVNYQVVLDVQKFEASKSEVAVLIAWTVQDGQGKVIKQNAVPTRQTVTGATSIMASDTPISDASTKVTEAKHEASRGEAQNYAAIARAQSLALGRVSADIAASLKAAAAP